MIEQQEVSGRPATVIYITKNFEPAEKETADMAKIRFDDGGVAFVNLRKPVTDDKSSARRGEEKSYGHWNGKCSA